MNGPALANRRMVPGFVACTETIDNRPVMVGKLGFGANAYVVNDQGQKVWAHGEDKPDAVRRLRDVWETNKRMVRWVVEQMSMTYAEQAAVDRRVAMAHWKTQERERGRFL